MHSGSRASASPIGFEPTGFFALRVAALPFTALTDWASGLALDRAPNGTAIAAARTALRDRLRIIAAQPRVREAIYVASPGLDQHLQAWLAQPPRENAKLESAVARYLARMAGRATPFGLFAGCGVGRIAESTALIVGDRNAFRRLTRLDNHYLFALVDALASRPDLRGSLRFRPNTTLYRAGHHWRFVRVVTSSARRRHQLLEIEGDNDLDIVMRAAANGASLDELVTALGTEADEAADTDQVREYVNTLVDLQVLTSDLSPLVTGNDALGDLVDRLAPIALANDVRIGLGRARDKLTAIDRHDGPVSPARYQEVADALTPLGTALDPSRLFQVDLVAATEQATLGQDVIQDITEAAEVLRRLSPDEESPALRRFREDFRARYEKQSVPLIEALDEEAGIGFDKPDTPSAEHAPLLDGLPLPSGKSSGRTWTAQDAMLLRHVVEAAHRHQLSLNLTERDVRALQATTPSSWPDTFAVFASVLPHGPDSQEPRVLIKSIFGPSGAELLGRFCHADERLLDAVRGHLRKEEAFHPEALFAEIVHVPEARVGNILSRPLLREYEIPYLGQSGAPALRQLPVTDLLVSVQDDDRIVLWSRRLDREVIPRMSNAHAFHTGHGVYRFLCSLQYQRVRVGLQWRWGALAQSPVLPRVSIGRAVLSRARWILAKSALPDERDQSDRQITALQAYREERGLPRFVAIEQGDNELPIDLDNVISCEILLKVVRQQSTATLVEILVGPGDLPAHGPDGGLVNEVIVPFVRTAAASRAAPAIRVAATVQRTFVPGSDWTFVKLYTGTASVDRLLKTAVPPAIDALVSAGIIDRWFFVRYADPHWHLRLRLRLASPDRRTELRDAVEQFATQAMAEGAIRRFAHDTYVREVERYGGDTGMVISEECFWRDSEAVLSLLQSIDENDMSLRWRLCLASWDALLSDLGMTPPDKLEFSRRLAASFFSEFSGDRHLARRLGDKYRAERHLVEGSFMLNPPTGPWTSAAETLRTRAARIAGRNGPLWRLRDAAPAIDVRGLAGSYLHMNANRLLRSAHRAQEMVLTDFLRRYYESLAARAAGDQ